MKPHQHAVLALALFIAMAGIGGFVTVQRLWCDVAAYEDAQMRPTGSLKPYVPSPGPVFLENDSYHWLGYAQRIARGETWRVRYTTLDNFPAGREVHWSQSVSWAMVVFGKARALFTCEPLATAVEKASLALNPILFALAAAGLFAALTARFGALPSAVCVAFVSTVGSVGWTFNALRPGHQGLHIVFGAASVLGLLFGGMGLTTRQPATSARWPSFRMPTAVDLPTARRWFTLAGVATGLALWVSATIESFFIYPMMGAFILLLALLPPRSVAAEDLVVQPDLWRRWGLTAGAVGLACYLLEYFPHGLAMRLEVNHPVYDIAVVGGGEALRALSRLRWGGGPVSRAQRWQTAGWLALSALPVLLIALGPVAWHHMRDVQMLRLHKFIGEFYSYDNFVRSSRLVRFFELYGIAPLVCLFAPVFLLRRGLTVTQVTWLWLPFAFACSFGAVAYLQLRWMAFFATAASLSAMVTAHFAFSLLPPPLPAARRTLVATLVLIALLVQPIMFPRQQISNLLVDLQGEGLEKDLIIPLLNKRMACALKASSACPKAVIADPSLAPSLGYFAGIPCLTSFYWENTEGLHKAVRFFTTKDPAEARRIAAETGATHVMLAPDPWMSNYLYFVAYGHYDTPDVANTFAGKLLAGRAPSWIQPDIMLNFIASDSYTFRGMTFSSQMETFRIQD